MTRLLTLGLDGAAWPTLERMMDDGLLPNLNAMVESGARGTLTSVTPPVTCPAWRCSTSGKNPGKLGVYWWLGLDRERGEITAPDARDFDTADVWDYLDAAGEHPAVVNVPMSYPPAPVDGLLVSGFGAPFELSMDDPLTHPPAAEERLREEYDWSVGVDDVTAPGGVDDALTLIESRLELLLDLVESDDYDYVHLTVFYLNVLQHYFGGGEETERAWQIVDDYLGRLPDGLTVLAYSDHGHSDVERTFVVNRYLLDEGYLHLKERAADDATAAAYELLKRGPVSPQRVASAARRVLPDSLAERLLTSGYPIPTVELAERVDWERSDAVALSQGPLYLNRERLGDDYERVRAELRAELDSLTVKGRTPLSSVRSAEDVYDGAHLDAAPDLLLSPTDGWELYGGVTPSLVEEQVTGWTSGNDPAGVVLCDGPDVAATDLGERDLVDVMPTVLRYMDCPVPTDVDGDAIAAAFDRLPEPGTRDPLPPAGERTATDRDGLEDRLEDLGYLA
ncbi:alkaline phosphatase family protein [Halarchaeum sp. P4]|uniref:alkaline phosphatase family protein n=1 Tax=Halarchaeum sp. P4 TaxID=3421639 RepID=UPI003EB93480